MPVGKKVVHDKKKIKSYSTPRIKARSFLTNISYNSIKEEDLFDKSFTFELYTLMRKNINPFCLEKKICDSKNREMIQMFWEEYNKPNFYKHICQSDNVMYLNNKNVIHPHMAEIVWKYVEKDETNFHKMKKKLLDNLNIFQFFYSTV